VRARGADVQADRAETDVARLQDEWRIARAAVADLPFDHTFEHAGEPFSLRMVHLHMIGEYSRHNGHADLLRERIDGAIGV